RDCIMSFNRCVKPRTASTAIWVSERVAVVMSVVFQFQTLGRRYGQFAYHQGRRKAGRRAQPVTTGLSPAHDAPPKLGRTAVISDYCERETAPAQGGSLPFGQNKFRLMAELAKPASPLSRCSWDLRIRRSNDRAGNS